VKVQPVAFPPCLMYSPGRGERSGQKVTSDLEKNAPFSQGLKNRSGRKARPCQRRCPVPQRPRSRSARPCGAGSAQGGGTVALPASHSPACLGSALASRQPSSLRAGAETCTNPPRPAPPSPRPVLGGTAMPEQLSQLPALPPTCPAPVPPGSVAFHCQRAAAVLGHGRAWCRMKKSSGTWQSALGSPPASRRVLQGLRGGCDGTVRCAKVCWNVAQGAACWPAALPSGRAVPVLPRTAPVCEWVTLRLAQRVRVWLWCCALQSEASLAADFGRSCRVLTTSQCHVSVEICSVIVPCSAAVWFQCPHGQQDLWMPDQSTSILWSME